jgi:hypothetical protein
MAQRVSICVDMRLLTLKGSMDGRHNTDKGGQGIDVRARVQATDALMSA